MKKAKFSFLIITGLCSLLPVPLYCQWLETTIPIPDSFVGLIRPNAFAYNATNNKVYVGGKHGGYVIAIDGSTNTKVAKIWVGSNVTAICWSSISNKIY